jgi:hypothetical protein
MGAGSAKLAGFPYSTGATLEEARKLLPRRVLKMKAALDRRDLVRAEQKAQGVLHTLFTWTSPDDSVSFSMTIYPADFHAHYTRACWVLDEVQVTHAAAAAAAWAGKPPMPPLPAEAWLHLQRVHLRVARELFGAGSLQHATELLNVAATALQEGKDSVAINHAGQASSTLLALRGEQYFYAGITRNDKLEIWNFRVPWEQLDDPLAGCVCGHIDCLVYLWQAHANKGEADNAHAAAARLLYLLEALHGRGAPATIPGLFAMAQASLLGGKGDLKRAVQWQARIISIHARGSGGAYNKEVALSVLWLANFFMMPGAGFDLATAERLLGTAKGLAEGCFAAADVANAEALQDTCRKYRGYIASGEMDAQGNWTASAGQGAAAEGAAAATALATAGLGAVQTYGGSEGLFDSLCGLWDKADSACESMFGEGILGLSLGVLNEVLCAL